MWSPWTSWSIKQRAYAVQWAIDCMLRGLGTRGGKDAADPVLIPEQNLLTNRIQNLRSGYVEVTCHLILAQIFWAFKNIFFFFFDKISCGKPYWIF